MISRKLGFPFLQAFVFGVFRILLLISFIKGRGLKENMLLQADVNEKNSIEYIYIDKYI